MLFKSVKCWSKPCVNALSAFAVYLILCPAALWAATLTVTPQLPYQTLTANNTINLYYPVTQPSPGPAASPTPVPAPVVDVGAGYSSSNVINVSVSQTSVSSPDNNIITLNVVTDTAGQTLSLKVGGVSVPIAAVAGNLCLSGNSACIWNNIPGMTNQYFAGVTLPGATTTIGIYPADICLAVSKQSPGTAQGCNGASVAPSSTLPMSLVFTTGTAPAATIATYGATSATATENFFFEGGGPSSLQLACPAGNAVPYFPSDGAILVDPSGFQLTTGGSATTAPTIPLKALLVVGREGSAPDTTNFTNNPVSDRLITGQGPQSAGGFTNSNSLTDKHDYQVNFAVSDYAGVVSNFGCPTSPVETADVQAFLKKSNCFIATAAFRSIDSGPVAMLRSFRDQILLRSSSGQKFVNWYYGWSPDAAEWLMKHPVYRFPVLLALVPVEIIAWMVLHPLLILLSIAFSGSILFWKVRAHDLA